MENVLDGILKIVNRRSPDDVRIKHRRGDHPFYRGLYLVMAVKYGGTSIEAVSDFADMNRTAPYYWMNNLHGWFFTRKDLKFDHDVVEREVKDYLKSLKSPDTFDSQAEEVLNRMSA